MTGAIRYRVFVHTSSSVLASIGSSTTCSGCLVNQQTTGSEYTIPAGILAGGTTYYWMARAGNDTAGSPNSVIRSFTTSLAAPNLVSPADGATNLSTQPQLTWSAVSGASLYRVFVHTSSSVLASIGSSNTCSGCLVNQQVTASSYSVPVGPLADGTTYYWMARAGSASAGSPNSVIRSFATAPATVPAPTLSGVQPSSVEQGTGAFWLTINGSGFSATSSYGYSVWAGADVNLSGAGSTGSAPAQVVSSSQIRVWVTSVAATAALGFRDVVVRYGAVSTQTVTRSSAFQVVAAPPPAVTLVAPHSGSFTVGDTMSIRWSATNQHHAFVILIKGGVEVATLYQQNPSTATSFDWQIPAVAGSHTLGGTDYKIKVAVWNATGASAGATSSGLLTIVAPKSPPQGLVPADGTEGIPSSGVVFEWRSTTPMSLLSGMQFTLRKASGSNGTLGEYVGDCHDKEIGRALAYVSQWCGALQPSQWYKFFIGFRYNDGSAPTGAGGFFKTRSNTSVAFAFAPVPDMAVAQPVTVTVRAVDANGFLDASFAGQVQLGALHSALVNPAAVNLRNGSWTGSVSLDAPSSSTALTATAWEGSRFLQGTSNAFRLLAQTYARGNLVVEVRNQQGPVSGVPVQVDRVFGANGPSGTTGADGRVTFAALDPARYSVRVAGGSWGDATRKEVEVAAALTTVVTVEVTTHRRPVLFVPGILGSTDSLKFYPELPKDSPAQAGDLKIFLSSLLGFGDLRQVLEIQGFTVYDVPWDWRVPLDQAWPLYLKPVIDKAKSSSPDGKVDIVSHSMGGLLVRAYIQSSCNDLGTPCYANDIGKFAMVGTPNHGSAIAYYLAEGADPVAADGGSWLSTYTTTLNGLYLAKEGQEAFKKGYDGNWSLLVERWRLKEFINKNIQSLRQLLPAYTGAFSPPSSALDSDSLNPFLASLNSSASLFRMVPSSPQTEDVLTRLLLSDEQDSTIETIKVGPGQGVYSYGVPDALIKANGDSTVLSKLPNANEELDTHFQTLRVARGDHVHLILSFRPEILEFITGQSSDLFVEPQGSLTAADTDELRLSIRGRVQPHIIAADGTELGVNPVTGDVSWPGAGSEVELIPGISGIGLANAGSGTYSVELRGPALDNEEISISAGWVSRDLQSGDEARALFHGSPIHFQFVVDPAASEKVRLIPPVPAPTGIAAANWNGLTRLSWQAPAGGQAVGYNIYGRTTGQATYSRLGTTTATFFDTGHPFLTGGDGEHWTYVVVAVGSDGSESFFQTVAENRAPVVASFFATPAEGAPPLSVAFHDTSVGELTSWSWDFNGDGVADSSERNPSHVYATPGVYSVSLTVAGPWGEDRQTRTAYIAVREITRDLDSLSIAGPATVTENGTATYAATAHWSDGSTSPVTPVWSEDSLYAAVDAAGILTVSAVPGNQSLHLVATYTSGSRTRTAVQMVSIVEAGFSCFFEVTGLDRPFPPEGGTGSIHVTTGSNCRWTAESQSSWLAVSSPTGAATGPADLAYTVSARPSGAYRRGFLTVAGRRLPVWQRGDLPVGGLYRSLFLRGDGSLLAWGANGNGGVGDGTTTNRMRPVAVKSAVDGVPDTLIAVATSGGHNLALRSDGALLAWGGNVSGQLGDGTSTDRSRPVFVRDGNGMPVGSVAAVAAGTAHSLALREDGTLLTWGNNYFGQLGDGTQETRSRPVVVTDDSGAPVRGVVAITASGNQSFALRLDGTVIAWGEDSYGKLGDGNPTHHRAHPVPVAASDSLLRSLLDIAAGSSHGLARSDAGLLWAWGDNQFGQLGDGTTTARLALTPVQWPVGSPVDGIQAVSAEGDHNLALRSDGTVLSWGRNDFGQVGDGSTANRISPVRVIDGAGVPLDRIIAVAAGVTHGLALRNDGTLFTWGHNGEGGSGDGTTVDHGRATALLDPLVCVQSLVPASASVKAGAQTGSVQVEAADGCPWTAASNASWITITSGSSGLGRGSVNYSVAPYQGSNPRTGTLTIAGRSFSVTQSGAEPLGFYTVQPCRVLDTRLAPGEPLASQAVRVLPIGGLCGVPLGAKAVSMNLTVVGPTGAGNVVLWPADLAETGTMAVSFSAGQVRANNAVLALSSGSGSLAAKAILANSGTVHLVIDVNGYFQ